jgi:hypothetical protein
MDLCCRLLPCVVSVSSPSSSGLRRPPTAHSHASLLELGCTPKELACPTEPPRAHGEGGCRFSCGYVHLPLFNEFNCEINYF